MKRISTQLVISFLIIALLPTIPLSWVVQDLLERRFGPTIADPLEVALESGLAESRIHLQELRARLEFRTRKMVSEELNEDGYLLASNGQIQPADSLAVFLAERPDLWKQAGELRISKAGSTEKTVRLGDVLVVRIAGIHETSAVVLQPLPAGMVARAGDLTSGMSLLRVVRGQDNRVLFSFVGPFLLVYGLLILTALGVGIIWSRQMVRPLEVLVGATRQVAEGNLEFRIKKQGPGEVGELIQSFDQMVGNLAEQRRDLARLERAAAWRGMARTLAHEVKSPLTPILLAVNQARDCYSGDDEKYQTLLVEVSEIVGEEIENLRRLVWKFGDFARLPKPELEPGDLQDLLEELVQLYGADCLLLDSSSTVENGWFDRDALRRALINLVDNGLAACEEAGRPGEIQLSSHDTSQGVRLVVGDKGTGIPEKHLNSIFEPDFTTKSNGMGLGLAIVENIIIGHGGKIKVESEMGLGTQFIITLPLTPLSEGRQSHLDGKP